MSKTLNLIIIGIIINSTCCFADTFQHRQTGEVFHGFATQKTAQNKTLIYIKEKSKFESANLAEYDITIDTNGRRNSVVVIPINQPETMLSQVVSSTVADTIEKASNNGPYLIVIQIDNPGGRGEYMKTICDSIIKTKNCPTVAYITAETSGGAFSAAAAPALACDKIYISPTASMGAVAPAFGRSAVLNTIDNYVDTFSSTSLATYRNYIAALANNNNRPALIAMAMLDRSLEIAEVVDAQGNKSFIQKAERKPTQTIVKTWTRPSLISDEQASSLTQSGDSSWMITSTEAVEIGIADKVADSLTVILQDYKVFDARVVTNRQAQKAAKKFATVKREVDRSLEIIEQLQLRSDNLVNQYNELDARYRENTLTSPYSTGTPTDVGSRDRKYNRGPINPYDALMSQRVSSKNLRDRTRPQTQQDAASMQLIASARAIIGELTVVLPNLASEYTNVIRLANKWPGTLPVNTSVQTLQTRYNTVLTLQNQMQFL
jgi:ATP-dependent protease ClpP protease subunit